MQVSPQLGVYVVILFAALSSIAFRGARMTVSLSALKLGADPVLIGMLAAATVALPSLLAVRAGKASDRYGPRYPLLFGSLGLGVALALPTLWHGIPGLFASVIVLGVANIYFHVCVHYTIGLFGDKVDRARNFSTFSLAGSIAAFIGPALAGFGIDHLGYAVTFLVLAAIATVPFLVLLAVPRMFPAHVPHPTNVAEGPAPKLLRDAPLRRVVLMSGTVLTGIELFTFYVPIYGRSIGLSASQIGLVLAAQAAAAFVVRLALPSLMKRLGAERLLSWALLCSGITYLMFPLFANIVALILVSFALGLSLGCGQPLSIMLVYDRAPPGRAGEALGLRLTVNKITQFGVPLVFGSLGSFFGVYPVFWANAALLTASGIHALRRDSTSAGSAATPEESRVPLAGCSLVNRPARASRAAPSEWPDSHTPAPPAVPATNQRPSVATSAPAPVEASTPASDAPSLIEAQADDGEDDAALATVLAQAAADEPSGHSRAASSRPTSVQRAGEDTGESR